MREDRNLDRQNRFDQQDLRERTDRDREIDKLEFGNDFFDDLPDRNHQTETRDMNTEKTNKRRK